jgi:hypothetical protein
MKRRAAWLSLLLVLAGCAGSSPADFGITGPGQPAPVQPTKDEDVFDGPSFQDPGAGFGTNSMPGTSTSRYYNYN